jgi:hypothetical protein
MQISRGSFLLATLVLAATYLFGGYSGRHDLFPFSILQALKARRLPPTATPLIKQDGWYPTIRRRLSPARSRLNVRPCYC